MQLLTSSSCPVPEVRTVISPISQMKESECKVWVTFPRSCSQEVHELGSDPGRLAPGARGHALDQYFLLIIESQKKNVHFERCDYPFYLTADHQ